MKSHSIPTYCAGILATGCFLLGFTTLAHRFDPVSNRARQIDRFTIADWSPPGVPGGGSGTDQRVRPKALPARVVQTV